MIALDQALPVEEQHQLADALLSSSAYLASVRSVVEDWRLERAAQKRKGFARATMRHNGGVLVLRLRRLHAPRYDLALKIAAKSGLRVAIDRDELIYYRVDPAKRAPVVEPSERVSLDEIINSRGSV